MKYSQTIGVIAALATVVLCFLPWSEIPGRQLVISGMHTAGTSYGKPGLFHLVLCGATAIFFLVPRIWAKRTNVFIAALNLAWAFRNYLIISSCMAGECPVRKPALYAVLALAIVIQLMALLPKVPLPVKNK